MKKKDIVKGVVEYCKLNEKWKPKVFSGGFWLVKSVLEGDEYLRFPLPKRIGGFALSGNVKGAKSFREVEDILAPLQREHGIGYDNFTVHIAPRSYGTIDHVVLVGDKELQDILKKISPIISEEIIPFFEDYKTLEAVHEKIEHLSKDSMGSFVFDPPVLKVATIKGLLKAKDFEEYINWAIGVYEEGARNTGRDRYVQSLAVCKSLKKHFGC